MTYKALVLVLSLPFICLAQVPLGHLGPLGAKRPAKRERSPLLYMGYYSSMSGSGKDVGRERLYGDMIYAETYDYTNLSHQNISPFVTSLATQDFYLYACEQALKSSEPGLLPHQIEKRCSGARVPGYTETLFERWLSIEASAGRKFILGILDLVHSPFLVNRNGIYRPENAQLLEEVKQRVLDSDHFKFTKYIINKFRRHIHGIQVMDEPYNQVLSNFTKLPGANLTGKARIKYIRRRSKNFKMFILPFLYENVGNDLKYGINTDQDADMFPSTDPTWDWVNINNYHDSFTKMEDLLGKVVSQLRQAKNGRKLVSLDKEKDNNFFKSIHNKQKELDWRQDHPRCVMAYNLAESRFRKESNKIKRQLYNDTSGNNQIWLRHENRIRKDGRDAKGKLLERYRVMNQFEVEAEIEKEIGCVKMNKTKMWLTPNSHTSTTNPSCRVFESDSRKQTNFYRTPDELKDDTYDMIHLIKVYGISTITWFLYKSFSLASKVSASGQPIYDQAICGAREYPELKQIHRNLFFDVVRPNNNRLDADQLN